MEWVKAKGWVERVKLSGVGAVGGVGGVAHYPLPNHPVAPSLRHSITPSPVVRTPIAEFLAPTPS
ncbi:MAG: hypothetical protein AAF609_16760 [Cyanobacteria bacterium P01_C01_bin.120]